SGAATLALEVLWTRMFAQVLQNSAYTFALVLTVFLVALGLGAGLARALMRSGADPARTLAALLLAAGLAAAPSRPRAARGSRGARLPRRRPRLVELCRGGERRGGAGAAAPGRDRRERLPVPAARGAAARPRPGARRRGARGAEHARWRRGVARRGLSPTRRLR